MPSSCCGSELSTCYISEHGSTQPSEASSRSTCKNPCLYDSGNVLGLQDTWGIADTPRGWAMRHGHRKRLAQPKRGKAVCRAGIQGQCQEIHQGRSVFKRSVNSEGKFRRNVLDWSESKHQQRVQLTRDVSDAYDEFYWEVEGCMLEHADEESQDTCMYNFADDEAQVLSRGSSMHSVAKQKPSVKQSPLDLFCSKLRDHKAVVETDSLKTNQPFAKLQQAFLMKHGEDICKNLQQCYHGPVKLRSPQLSLEVQHRFVEACDTLSGVIRPAFHGTSPANFPSIFQRGLLVPGQQNELRAVNGSTHGVGIYTADVHSASLSFGFSREIDSDQKLLVCGVLDDAVKLSQQYTFGRQAVVAESENVRHVGSAMVVFDNKRVAPLFEVSRDGREGRTLAAVFDWARHALLLKRVSNVVQQQLAKKARLNRTQRIGQYRRFACDRSFAYSPVSFSARRGARKRRLKGC